MKSIKKEAKCGIWTKVMVKMKSNHKHEWEKQLKETTYHQMTTIKGGANFRFPLGLSLTLLICFGDSGKCFQFYFDILHFYLRRLTQLFWWSKPLPSKSNQFIPPRRLTYENSLAIGHLVLYLTTEWPFHVLDMLIDTYTLY